MTVAEWISEFESLPGPEREALIRYIRHSQKPWIPESFRQGMIEADLGQLIEMEVALTQSPRR
jgi:hypothetical protein